MSRTGKRVSRLGVGVAGMKDGVSEVELRDCRWRWM